MNEKFERFRRLLGANPDTVKRFFGLDMSPERRIGRYTEPNFRKLRQMIIPRMRGRM